MNGVNGHISFKGKLKKVPNIQINQYDIITEGRIVKIARIKEEWLQYIDEYGPVLDKLNEGIMKADIFTFIQRMNDYEPKYGFYFELDNRAAIPISTYENWLENQVHQMVKRAIKKSMKRGIDVRLVEFNDHVVEGIMKIYNETPLRQGREFWHFGKNFDSVKKENGTFLDRSQFVAAYLDDSIIGFMKIVFVENAAFPMQILSMNSHRDKSPTNALIAKAVQVCADRGVQYFFYGKMRNVNNGLDSLSLFKERNGFKKFEFPRYYVPISFLGKWVLKGNLHHGILGFIPEKYINYVKEIRGKYFQYRYRMDLNKEMEGR